MATAHAAAVARLHKRERSSELRHSTSSRADLRPLTPLIIAPLSGSSKGDISSEVSGGDNTVVMVLS